MDVMETDKSANDVLESCSISVDDLADELFAAGEEAFRRNHGCNFLVLLLGPPKLSDWIDPNTDEASFPKLKVARRIRSGLRAVPLVKSNRNAFRSKITIGRARNNDVVIRSPKVSKLHGSFILGQKGNIFYQDLGSLNGTNINARKLAKREQVELKNGDLISIWRYVFEFNSPDAFIEKLNRLRR